MFSGFLEFFKKPVQYNIYGNDYRTFIIAFGGMQFGKGLFTVFNKVDALDWQRKLEKAFPEYKGTFRLFGYDWMGRCFAVPTGNEDKIIVFDPGVFDVYEVSLGFLDFVNKAIPMSTNECLSSDAFISWQQAFEEELGSGRCVGYKVPLFLGGKDEPDNFELIDMSGYWYMIIRAGMKFRGVPEDEPDGNELIGEQPVEDAPAGEALAEAAIAGEKPAPDEDDMVGFADDFDDELTEDEYFARQADEAEDFFLQQKKRAVYIRRNVDTYLEKFKRMHNNDSRISWNWCAFLFCVIWLAYRKLYKAFILIVLLTFLLTVGVGVAFIPLYMRGFNPYEHTGIVFGVSFAVGLIPMLISGMFGNLWYRRKLDKLVAAGDNAETREEKEMIYKKGGVNIPFMIILLVIFALNIASIPLAFI